MLAINLPNTALLLYGGLGPALKTDKVLTSEVHEDRKKLVLPFPPSFQQEPSSLLKIIVLTAYIDPYMYATG